jgi:hypothetical protein
MKNGQLVLCARVYAVLARSGEPLRVARISELLFAERWKGSWWFRKGGVSTRKLWGALRLLRARGLVARTDGGWVVRRRIGNPSALMLRLK